MGGKSRCSQNLGAGAKGQSLASHWQNAMVKSYEYIDVDRSCNSG